MRDGRPIIAPTVQFADLVEPDLSTEAARRTALGMRAHLPGESHLLTGRAPDVLRALHHWLEWDPPATRASSRR